MTCTELAKFAYKSTESDMNILCKISLDDRNQQLMGVTFALFFENSEHFLVICEANLFSLCGSLRSLHLQTAEIHLPNWASASGYKHTFMIVWKENKQIKPTNFLWTCNVHQVCHDSNSERVQLCLTSYDLMKTSAEDKKMGKHFADFSCLKLGYLRNENDK